MAESRLPGAGWGVFTLKDRAYGDKLLFPDVTIPLPDVPVRLEEGVAHIIQNYSWYSGGNYASAEGYHVQSIIPGMSMLCNTGKKPLPQQDDDPLMARAIPSSPLPPMSGRRGSPEAGSYTYYGGRQFHAYMPIEAGSEILIDYGRRWDTKTDGFFPTEITKATLGDLEENGMCLDNIRPYPGQFGYGAVATRPLSKGTMIAPFPMISINRTSLSNRGRTQLLLNYCFGNKKSTLLLYPYSPVSNYVNHADKPNAKLVWSARAIDLEESMQMTAADVLSSRRRGLLMELVALTDIKVGEEVTIDYGADWQEAYRNHVESFDASLHGDVAKYKYAADLNHEVSIRTEEEQKRMPYPENLQLSCYYVYDEANLKPHPNSIPEIDGETITTAKWSYSENLWIPANLIPCRIHDRIKRKGKTLDGAIQESDFYTAQMILEDRPGERHIVTSIPRAAIEFTNKVLTTDQQLPNAFRHEIGLAPGIYPEAWLDI